jgi:hypothetical protein
LVFICEYIFEHENLLLYTCTHIFSEIFMREQNVYHLLLFVFAHTCHMRNLRAFEIYSFACLDSFSCCWNLYELLISVMKYE